MEKWRSNGVRLCWPADIGNETFLIYMDKGTLDKLTGFNKFLSGEKVLKGFEFDLKILK